MRPYGRVTGRHIDECGELRMTERQRRDQLRAELAKVNAEWRDLSRARGTATKLSRMVELRSARLVFTAELFELERQERRAS